MNYLIHRLSLCPALSILSVLVFAVLPARGDFLWFKSQEKAKITAPSGSHLEGRPMICFTRLTWEGVGMHVGILPGYAASHGCIRLPSEVEQDLYAKVNVGTLVRLKN